MSLMEKKYEDPWLGVVTLRKSSRARRISIRLRRDASVLVTMPFTTRFSSGMAFLDEHKSWAVLARHKVMDAAAARDAAPHNADIPGGEELAAYVERLRKVAKMVLPARVGELAERYGFGPVRVCIKHNSSNWGSCSVRGNVNLNLNLVRVPQLLRDYVILHELSHTRHMDHGAAFHELLESLCHDNLNRMLQDGDEYALQFLGNAAQYASEHHLTVPHMAAEGSVPTVVWPSGMPAIHRFLQNELKDYKLV